MVGLLTVLSEDMFHVSGRVRVALNGAERFQFISCAGAFVKTVSYPRFSTLPQPFHLAGVRFVFMTFFARSGCLAQLPHTS